MPWSTDPATSPAGGVLVEAPFAINIGLAFISRVRLAIVTEPFCLRTTLRPSKIGFALGTVFEISSVFEIGVAVEDVEDGNQTIDLVSYGLP